MQKTTKKVQNKQNNETKQNIIEFVRWVLLGPAVCVAWLVGACIGAYISKWFVTTEFFDSYAIGCLIFSSFVIPSIVMFFAAKIIAPKYKKISGIVAVVVCVLWDLFLFLNLMMYGIAG
jgi:hypothetical protein